MSKQEELLRDYRPTVHVAPLDPELKRKVRRRREKSRVSGMSWDWGSGARARGEGMLEWVRVMCACWWVV